MQAGQPPRPVASAVAFAARGSKNCNGLTSQPFQTNQSVQTAKAGVINAAIFFIFAHELGHQVLRHVDRPPASNEASRRNEAAADAWAFRQGYVSNVNPLAALSTFFFLASFSGRSIEEEVLSTHPLGIRRLKSMLADIQTFANSDPDFQRRLQHDGAKADWDSEMQNLQTTVDENMRDLGLQ